MRGLRRRRRPIAHASGARRDGSARAARARAAPSGGRRTASARGRCCARPPRHPNRALHATIRCPWRVWRRRRGAADSALARAAGNAQGHRGCAWRQHRIMADDAHQSQAPQREPKPCAPPWKPECCQTPRWWRRWKGRIRGDERPVDVLLPDASRHCRLPHWPPLLRLRVLRQLWPMAPRARLGRHAVPIPPRGADGHPLGRHLLPVLRQLWPRRHKVGAASRRCGRQPPRVGRGAQSHVGVAVEEQAPRPLAAYRLRHGCSRADAPTRGCGQALCRLWP